MVGRAEVEFIHVGECFAGCDGVLGFGPLARKVREVCAASGLEYSMVNALSVESGWVRRAPLESMLDHGFGGVAGIRDVLRERASAGVGAVLDDASLFGGVCLRDLFESLFGLDYFACDELAECLVAGSDVRVYYDLDFLLVTVDGVVLPRSGCLLQV